ncbi:MAG: T9SS type A sorting domain-containing protein [Bacteroidota bacterium]
MRLFATLLALLVFALPARAQETLGIFVGNQGDPSSLTYLDPDTGEAEQLLVGQIGRFLQGMQLMNETLYVTAPGASTIDVVDPDTQQRVGQISDPAFAAARYIAQVSDTKAYVTTQNFAMGATESEIVILNLTDDTVSGRITVPVQPEGITVAAGRAYVALGGFAGPPELAVIDTATDALLGTVNIGCPARFVLADGDGDVFAVCNGTDQVVVFDTAAGNVATTVTSTADLGSAFGLGQDAALLGSGDDERLLVVTATGLVPFDVDAYTFGSAIAIADTDARPVGAVGYDAERDQYILGRPDPTNPFSAAGTVTTHSASGALLGTVAAGVFPDYVSVYAAPSVANEGPADAADFALTSVYPNPMADRAAVAFTLGQSAPVRVSVYDALGREVAVLADGPRAAGDHTVALDAAVLPSGVYLVRVSAGGRAATQTVTRLR